MRKFYNNIAGKPEVERPLGRPRRVRIILEWMLRKQRG
jgi:hypothetical protein